MPKECQSVCFLPLRHVGFRVERSRTVFALIASYLLLVFLLPLALSAVIGYRSLPVGRVCPECGGETLPLLRRSLRVLSAMNRRTLLQRRWCFGCGWEGLLRVPRAPGAPAPAAPSRTRARPTSLAEIAPGTPTQTLNVRLLDVDGTAWRVMLQCWTSTGLVYGRLVFVSPTGRLWLDAVESFTGGTESEALVQVRSLPDPLLARRLRRLALRREA
jgi:hypothetical protein